MEITGYPICIQLHQIKLKQKPGPVHVSVVVCAGKDRYQLNLGRLTDVEITRLLFDGEQNFRLGKP